MKSWVSRWHQVPQLWPLQEGPRTTTNEQGPRFPDPQRLGEMTDHCCCFKPLSFGVICYAAIDMQMHTAPTHTKIHTHTNATQYHQVWPRHGGLFNSWV